MSEQYVVVRGTGTFVIVRPDFEAPWISDLRAQLRQYSMLDDNWDLYGGRPVSRNLADYAINLVTSLLLDDGPLPVVGPTSEGGLVIEWEVGMQSLIINMPPGQVPSVYWEDQETNETWELPLPVAVPDLDRVFDKLAKSQ